MPEWKGSLAASPFPLSVTIGISRSNEFMEWEFLNPVQVRVGDIGPS